MDREKFNSDTLIFSRSVRELLSCSECEHVWLNGIEKMLLSMMNLEIILEDMISFRKYVRGKNVLDFGTGSGYIALLLASNGFDVNAVDVDSYIEYEKNDYNKFMTKDQKKLWGILADSCKNLLFTHYNEILPYNDNSFDGICAYAVFEHIPNDKLRNILIEIRRVLKPGGILFISRLPRKLAISEHLANIFKLGHHEKLFWDNEMSLLLTKAEFEIVEKSFEEVIPAYPESLTNRFFPFLRSFNQLLLKTPLKYFSHHLRIVSEVIK